MNAKFPQPIPTFAAKCGHCNSEFTYTKREAMYSAGWGNVPAIVCTACPVCESVVRYDFVPDGQPRTINGIVSPSKARIPWHIVMGFVMSALLLIVAAIIRGTAP